VSAREYAGAWLVECNGADDDGDEILFCQRYAISATLLLATAAATRAGWTTRTTVVVRDGVPRQTVAHHCPAHKGVAP